MKIFALYFCNWESGNRELFYNHNDLKEDECRRIISEHLITIYKEGHAKELKNLQQFAKPKKDRELFGWMIDNLHKDGAPLMQLWSPIRGGEKLWEQLKTHGLEHIEEEQRLTVYDWDHLRHSEGVWSLVGRMIKGRATKQGFRWWWKKLHK